MRRVQYFTCTRCGKTNPDYLTFGARKRHYCLNHIPRTTRIRMWLRERLENR